MYFDFLHEEIINVWIDEDVSEETINKKFKEIDKFNQNVYDFVFTYYDYFITRRDYGKNHKFTMIEAHVLTDIIDNPEITVSELAEKWDKTKSALSQTVRKLINRGYVRRVNDKDNAKVFFLHPTEKAKEFAFLHKKYDVIDTIKMVKRLLRKFSPEEVGKFYEVLHEYIAILNDGEKIKR